MRIEHWLQAMPLRLIPLPPPGAARTLAPSARSNPTAFEAVRFQPPVPRENRGDQSSIPRNSHLSSAMGIFPFCHT